MINLREFSKSYNQFMAVSNLTLEIKNGEIMGFAGLNGAGKTTTIRAISGLIFPTGGSIEVDGHNIVNDKVMASMQIGLVPEFPNFELDAKPLQLLKYYAGFYGINSADAEKRAIELLKKLGIYQYADKKLKMYSQGMKKRFSIASALIGDPNNYLFDETLNGLDPQGVKDVRDLMLSLKKEGKCVFLSSHILTELQNVADRIAIIKQGRLIKILERDDLANLGNTVIKIGIRNPDNNINSVLKGYGDVIFENSFYFIRNASKNLDTSEINSELVKSGYRVFYISRESEALEEYFLKAVN
ncbi:MULTISPECIES: ABC transporter ATP-binding protein [Acidiplasma]|jgi:ABC-2 type transport system ATP-binding protein|uniref:ABC transporter domain-containing protein n=1 Tax=Acidiplasma aeolicum TaxID=507754 RepID=A0A0P9CL60_9ARCH|nr:MULTISPECIES: ABC transporter ATP-binding protein [Acidiplasma]KJE49586.1 hypothetical protein TZ01_00170 [Acidiplasma sp. MBA-1]KPV46160.1 hypothetical protein SE19_06830 [Acidiplasma aeolicum]KQB36301.1 hypothetical protein AOG54_07625 [Acidiplasma aeolicum]WMT55866.1 MAG: ABC transporter ATP-binding protein [Acidiplasma sp.]